MPKGKRQKTKRQTDMFERVTFSLKIRNIGETGDIYMRIGIPDKRF